MSERIPQGIKFVEVITYVPRDWFDGVDDTAATSGRTARKW
jgi:hypothetical protein